MSDAASDVSIDDAAPWAKYQTSAPAVSPGPWTKYQGDAAPAGDDDAALLSKASPSEELPYAANQRQIARASLAPDPQTQIKRYAQSFGQPESDFSMHGDRIIRKVPQTDRYTYVEPSVSAQSGLLDKAKAAGDWMASGAGQAIPMMGGATGAAVGALAGIESGPGALATGAAAGAAGAASGEVLRQKLDTESANDPDTPIDWGNVAWQAVQGAAIEPVNMAIGALGRLALKVPGVQSVLAKAGIQTKAQLDALAAQARAKFNESNPLGLPPEVMADVGKNLEGEWDKIKQTTADAKSLGVDTLSLGQKTNSPVIKKLERWLAGTPEGAETFGRTRQLQNETQVPNAVNQTLDAVAPSAAPGETVGDFRDAADAVVKKAADAQAAQAKTAYAAALDDPAKPLDFNDDMKALFQRPMMKEAWDRAQTSAANRGQTLPKFVDFNAAGDPVFSDEVQPTWRSVDQIKRALDDIKNNPANQNRFGVPSGKGADAASLKSDLLGLVDPQNPAYKAARGTFGQSADAIDQVLQGGIGQIQRMSGADTQSMVNRIFAGGNSNIVPSEVGKVRQLFQGAGKGAEWNAALRSYFDNGLDQATRRLQNGGEMGNVAGKMLDLGNTQQQRLVIANALGDPVKADKISRMFGVLTAASRMLPEGSPTNVNAEISKGARNKVVAAGRAALGWMTPHGLLDKSVAALDDHLASINEPAARRQIMNFVLSPDSDAKLQAFLQNMPTPQAMLNSPVARANAVKQIGRFATAAGVAGLANNGDGNANAAYQ